MKIHSDESAPRCVVFLDEVDAILASRISSRDSGSAIAHRSVITEFMQEMDGLKTAKSQGNVVVIGATNRFESIHGMVNDADKGFQGHLI